MSIAEQYERIQRLESQINDLIAELHNLRGEVHGQNPSVDSLRRIHDQKGRERNEEMRFMKVTGNTCLYDMLCGFKVLSDHLYAMQETAFALQKDNIALEEQMKILKKRLEK